MISPELLDSQKKRDTLTAYWPRKLSPYLTRILVKTPITANQTTLLWGAISAANAGLVYLAATGRPWLAAGVFLVWVLTYTLDCVDGEVARYRGAANPVAGKLLDGICHRMTEYALLASYVAAAHTLTGSALVLPIAVLLVAGDAMYTYVYERRLTTLRVHAGFTGQVSLSAETTYERGTSWSALGWRQRLQTFAGQVQYRSAYFAIVLANVSGEALLVGLAVLAGYKHAAWMRLIVRTLRSTAVSAAAAPARPQAASNPGAAPL